MAYNIALHTHQSKSDACNFRPVEFTNWNAVVDKWIINGKDNDDNTLHMGGSGVSGGIRFSSDKTEEQFIVFVGVHNYVRWCDIVVDPGERSTATALHPVYYQEGSPQANNRWRTLAHCTAKNKHGRAINLTYTVGTGNNLKADLVIG